MSAQHLTPLPVVVPLLTAAVIAVTGPLPRRVHDGMATTAALASAVICAVLLAHAGDRPTVEWLGGWHPHHGVATGIALVADQLGAGAALLTAILVTASLVYSWVYFDDLDGLVHALMLVLCAGLIGVCLTGDLFTMAVFFVLTTVAAIGLTAVENEHQGPLQGAVNFAVVNSIAGFALLFGVALAYGRTGALNLGQLGVSLGGHSADALVGVSFALLAFGVLTKAGIAPFHFWLPDAYAVAPTPVSAVFSGAMVTTMLLGAARLLTTAFGPVIEPHHETLRAVLVGAGAVTAVVSAIACFQQRHLKRVLAFATASQAGTMLCGVGLLRDEGLAGAALTAVGFSLAMAALFGAAGVLVRRFSSVDEFQLKGRAGDLPLTAVALAAGAFVLAGLPPSASFYGQWLISTAARDVGYVWLPPLLALTAAICAAAILRVAARIFLGWGAAEPGAEAGTLAEEQSDLATSRRPSILLILVALTLIAAAVVLGPIPGFARSVEVAGAHFRDSGSYIGVVLTGRSPHYASVADVHLDASAFLVAAESLIIAPLLAWAGLRGRSVFPAPVTKVLRAAHSGHVGDYVVWWTIGMTVLGGLVLWAVAG